MVIVLVAVPTYDLVASLLMLSWYDFGCNRNVGFWMYTGMAIRMAQDLGMHKGGGDIPSSPVSNRKTPARPAVSPPQGAENANKLTVRGEEETSLQLNHIISLGE